MGDGPSHVHFAMEKVHFVNVLNAHSNINLLKEHQSWESSQGVASPDAWCIGGDTLSVIWIWAHLKTSSF